MCHKNVRNTRRIKKKQDMYIQMNSESVSWYLYGACVNNQMNFLTELRAHIQFTMQYTASYRREAIRPLMEYVLKLYAHAQHNQWLICTFDFSVISWSASWLSWAHF